MARRNQHIVSFRVNDQMMERLIKFAMDNGLYNASDQPNVSAAVLMLVSTGFQDYQGQQGMVTAYEAARAGLMEEVKRELNLALENVANRIE